MRVLALAAEAFGGYGGIAQSTQDLMGALAATVLVKRIDILPRIGPYARETGEPKIFQRPALSGRFAYALAAAGMALRQRPRLVYCGHLFMASLAVSLARIIGAKLIFHLHGSELYEPLGRARLKALERADLILCVSRDTQAKLLSSTSVRRQQTAVIFNTVSPAFCPGDRAMARKRFGLADQFALLTVARLETRQRHKGHDLVLEQLARLRASGRDILYLICGDGSDRERLAARAQMLGVAEHVRFLGRVPFEDLPDLYRAADLYVMPSTGEGFGIAFVEAMVCGTPAIGLDERGAGEALRDGELGIATNAEAFPEALENCIGESVRSGENLSSAVLQHFGRVAFQKRVDEAFVPLFGHPIQTSGDGF